jgi:hypothetical protein
VSKRLVGFRAGVSYTPQADSHGIDGPNPVSLGNSRLEFEDVTEAGISFSHLFREADLRLRFGLTGSFATTHVVNAAVQDQIEDYHAIGVGLELEKGSIRTGARYLDTNKGIAGSLGDYSALEFGLIKDFETLSVGLEYGYAEDAFYDLESEGISLSISKKINDSVNFVLGYADVETSQGRDVNGVIFDPNSRNSLFQEGKGPFFELNMRYK